MKIYATINLENGDDCEVFAEVWAGDFDDFQPVNPNVKLSRMEEIYAGEALQKELDDAREYRQSLVHGY